MSALHFSDSLHFLRNVNPIRALNVAKVFSSYHLSRLADRPLHSGYPFTLSIEPTTHCNLRCPECPSGLRSFTRDTGMIDKSFFENTMDELKEHLLFLYLYFQGEPYLHSQFTDLVSYASSKNIYTVTSTNAHYLDDENCRKTVESGLSRLIISVDGTTQESYEKYRIGGNLEKVLKGTKSLVGWRKKLKSSRPHIVFQMVVFSHNENEIESLNKLVNECGADEVKLKTAQIYDFEHGNKLIPKNEKYSRYIQPELTLNGFQIKNPLLNYCWKMWHSCVVTWDGLVVPCCFDKDATHVMGDLKKQSFREIWNGESYRRFRSRLFRSRKEIDICSNCSEGMKVFINKQF